MIDMHLHTTFSDGHIHDIKQIVEHCEIISITDHNSILAYNYFTGNIEKTKMILGCEITIDRAPDYLVYFPGQTFSPKIEEELTRIRLSEEFVIKQCYQNLGYLDWEKDIKRAYSAEQRIKNARTRDLAAIIHLYRNNLAYDNGSFDFDDLRIARKQRREYANTVGNPLSEDTAFDIAEKYGGVIVLAHPIRTAIKKCPFDKINITTVKEKLIALLDLYAKNLGKTIEWEYFSDSSMKKYQLSCVDLAQIREIIITKANEHGFSFTIGSDSHSLAEYEVTLRWLRYNNQYIGSGLADWITRGGV